MLSLFAYLVFPVEYMRVGVRSYFIFGASSVLLAGVCLVLILLKYERRRQQPDQTQQDQMQPDEIQQDETQQDQTQLIPDGPGGLPLLGFWPQLGTQPYRVLGDLADTYGPLCSVSLGSQRVLIVNDRVVLDEILNEKSAIFSGSPRPTSLPIAGLVIGNSREGSDSQNLPVDIIEDHRKFLRGVTSELKTAILETHIKNQLENVCEEIHGHQSEPVDFRSLMQRSWTVVLERLLLGGTNKFSATFATTLRLFRQRQEIAGRTGSCLAVTDWLKRWRTLANATNYAQLMEIESEFQASCFRLTSTYELDLEENHKSFLEMYLAERARRQAANSEDKSFNGDQLTYDTVLMLEHLDEAPWVATLWALLLVSRYPEVQEKINAELNSLYGGSDVTPRWSDRHRLKYTWAAVAEIRRIAPVVTLDTLPRNIAATSLSGLFVEANSSLVANTWRINRDPDFWVDPQNFRPERFKPEPREGASGGEHDLKSRFPEHVLPYFLGPKSWIDSDVIVMQVFLSLVTLMLRFSFLPPEGELICEDGFTLKPASGMLRVVPR